MTQEEKNIKICEARGWRVIKDQYGIVCSLDGIKWCSEGALPNHFTDLNVMHEAENALNNGMLGGLYDKFEKELAEVCYQEGKRRNVIHATAAQRAEAFGLTLNLWKQGE